MSVTRTTDAFLPPVPVVVPAVLLLLLLDPPQPAARSATAAARSPSLRAFMWWSMPTVRFLALLLASLPVGHSVEGRAIRPVVLGSAAPAHTLLVVGCIHGNEPAGPAVPRGVGRGGAPARAGHAAGPTANPAGR